MDREETRPQRVIVAMKGHPGSGKTTLARFIAASLGCPLIDKDDVRDSTFTIESQLASDTTIQKLLNHLSYEVIWRMVETQLSVGLSVVIDSPLSHRAHLDRLAKLAESFEGTQLVVVECKPEDEVEWRRRLENRGKNGCDGSWHKPATWRDLERLLEGYNGCTDYDVGEVPKLVLDTTAKDVKVTEHAELVLRFLDACAH
ncbi:putative P-loop containing nucleoside triphosphate hydrolase [Helianthus anomalus]